MTVRLALTGASGFIGSAVRRLHEGPLHAVGRRGVDFDIKAAADFMPDAIIHLAGEPIGARWTSSRRQRILDSRVEGTRQMARLAADLGIPLVSASAEGYYGQTGDDLCKETDPPGDDFLADVCVAWEAAAEAAREAGGRVVHPRFSIVLGPGGALGRMLPPFKMGLGGRIGDGRQWWSWVHRDDAATALLHVAGSVAQGPLNIAAGSTRNEDLVRTLGDVLHRPTVLPLPAFAVTALFGDMGRALLLAGHRLDRTVLEATGFRPARPDLKGALQAAVDG